MLLFKQYIRVTIPHFLTSVLGGVLFVLGAQYSEGSDGTTSTPYYIPAIVLCALHFILTLLSFIIWRKARNGWFYDHGTTYKQVKFLYTVLIILSTPYGVIGCILVGNSGICNDKCYYTVNEDENYAIAIVIIITHIWHLLFAIFIFTYSREEPRVGATSGSKVNQHIKQIDTNYTNHLIKHLDNAKSKQPSPKPVPRNTSTDKQIKTTQSNDRLSLARQQQRVAMDDMFIGGKTTPGRRLLPLVRRTSALDDSVLNIRHKTEDKPVIKPLPPKKKIKKVVATGKAAGKLNTLYRTVQETNRRNVSPDVDGPFRLASSSSNSSSSSDETKQNKHRKHRHSDSGKMIFLNRTNSRAIRGPPPSYNDVMANDKQHPDQNPYVIPALTSENHGLPDDIYTGTSYPDSELVVIQPTSSDVMRRTVQL